jgi:Holliday junction DNA helicase RuvB
VLPPLRQSAVDPTAAPPDRDFERTLRPVALDEFLGQPGIKENLRVFLKAARQRNEPLDHVMLSGPPGLGKTTLAHIIAHEMSASITATSGPVLDKPAAIAGLLTNLNHGDVLFIDEIHRLSPVVEEYLYSAMEDYRIDIMIDSGPNARSVQISVPPFTLIGATTRKGLLTSPLRARFGIDFRYDYYTADVLQAIVERSAAIMGVEITSDGAQELARRSRGTPRVANRLLRRTRDFAEVEHDGRIDRVVANRALDALNVDETGLDEMDARVLRTLIEKFGGGPTGLQTLAVSIGEDAGTIEEVYEPFLIMEGFMQRTPRGRVATPRAYRHLGFDLPTAPPSADAHADLFGN